MKILQVTKASLHDHADQNLMLICFTQITDDSWDILIFWLPTSSQLRSWEVEDELGMLNYPPPPTIKTELIAAQYFAFVIH